LPTAAQDGILPHVILMIGSIMDALHQLLTGGTGPRANRQPRQMNQSLLDWM
jgi:hypothetical protein